MSWVLDDRANQLKASRQCFLVRQKSGQHIERKRGSWIIPKNGKLGRESKKREQEGENSGRAAEEGEQEKLAVTPTGTTVSQKSSPCSTIVVVSVRFCVIVKVPKETVLNKNTKQKCWNVSVDLHKMSQQNVKKFKRAYENMPKITNIF